MASPLQSKVIISKDVLIIAYNKLFAKWLKAKGAKKDAIGMEMEALNEKINQ